eukprot:TRINITY_DN2351_c0_g2_i2.p1 TRINITY_DN2351_c0_g2~~TRINITY_DN2351_c0_g2_i2.p1  ORF type:complete len:153 (-),score=39.79 TRINITY_DN2351_c0_g2_i2:107-565(-)
MGKERPRSKSFLLSHKSAPFNEVRQEIDHLWSKQPTYQEIKEDCRINAIVRSQHEDRCYALQGFAREGNGGEELFRRLLQLRAVTAATRLLALFKLEEGVWRKADAQSCAFEGESVVMIVVELEGNKKVIENKKLRVRKAIKKLKEIPTEML